MFASNTIYEGGMWLYRTPKRPPWLRNNSGFRIGALNIHVFGKTKASKADVMQTLAQILRRYDIVLIQEIRNKDGTAITELLDQVNRENEQKYTMTVSERLGRTWSKEQYAFFYKLDAGISVEDSYHYDDGVEGNGDTFQCEPFVVRFRIESAVTSDIVLIPLHADPDEAPQEIGELVEVYQDAVAKLGVKNALIIGDLNAGCSYVKSYQWSPIPLRSDNRYRWEIGDHVDTTVSKTTCPYDRIIADGNVDLVPETAKPFHFDTEYGLDYEQARKVSDDYPVEVNLTLAETGVPDIPGGSSCA